jgi:hypothetical protein
MIVAIRGRPTDGLQRNHIIARVGESTRTYGLRDAPTTFHVPVSSIPQTPITAPLFLARQCHAATFTEALASFGHSFDPSLLSRVSPLACLYPLYRRLSSTVTPSCSCAVCILRIFSRRATPRLVLHSRHRGSVVIATPRGYHVLQPQPNAGEVNRVAPQ